LVNKPLSAKKLQIDKILTKVRTLISHPLAKLVSIRSELAKKMFLLRCAFWLGVGFVVIKPFAFDANTASAVANEVYAQGKVATVQQIASVDCQDLTCSLAQTTAIASIGSTNVPFINSPNAGDVSAPTPPMRPAWAG